MQIIHTINELREWRKTAGKVAFVPTMGNLHAGHMALVREARKERGELRGTGVRVVTLCPGYVDTPLTRQNDFTMPALLTPEQAAQAMLRGWERGDFELHFPRRFTLWLKLLRVLPYRWYFPLVHRMTGL